MRYFFGAFAVIFGSFVNVIVQAGHPLLSLPVFAFAAFAAVTSGALSKAAAISRSTELSVAFIVGVLAGNVLINDLGRGTGAAVLFIASAFTLSVYRYGREPFRFVGIVFSVIALLSPAFIRPFMSPLPNPEATADLTPILHLILDEQEASDLDGFSTWTNARSRFSSTTDSLTEILDGYEESLRERGYAVTTIQSSYFEICEKDCATYDFNHLSNLAGLPFTKHFELLVNAWLQQFEIFSVEWLSPAPLNSKKVIESIEKPERGEALIVHAIFPHAPYYFAANCSFRPDPSSKGGADDREKYDDQSSCAKSLVPRWDDVLTIVHGDHGARLFPLEGERNLRGTMYAVREPGEPTTTNDEVAFVSDLLRSTLN